MRRLGIKTMQLECAGMRRSASHVAPHETLLDNVFDKFNEGRIGEGMNELLPELKTLRLRAEPKDWSQAVEACLRHPVKGLLHQDPFTRRAFSKPRGYAGDAVLLDYVYGREEGWPPPEDTTELGRAIFEYTTQSAACEGVRARRGFVAEQLDRLVDEVARPHVLSIAAGHLREAALSAAVKRRKLGRFVALDADARSLKEVERCYGRCGVETKHANIRQLLTRKVNLGQFDFVYSTGLFDYLQQPTAQRLAWNMFQMLRSGGRLVVANFLPGIPDLGYMESYMAWPLIYRTRLEMMGVSSEIPQPQIREVRVFTEENQNIIFLQITKA
jgi:extracellular factor (EF) 3-hydroxypalmitic acid methyl ester biosynthesis protein